jgi:hypothetical protein
MLTVISADRISAAPTWAVLPENAVPCILTSLGNVSIYRLSISRPPSPLLLLTKLSYILRLPEVNIAAPVPSLCVSVVALIVRLLYSLPATPPASDAELLLISHCFVQMSISTHGAIAKS